MTSSPGPRPPGSAAGPAEILTAVQRSANLGADALMQHVPDTGDHPTGRAVDSFVEQAGDALRALAQAVDETLAAADAPRPADRGADPVDAELGAAELPPRGWHW
ncbi:MAG: hypothetical protein M3Y71_03800 [Actinomycetota bacterium]|nr:hypothetical protein [Actinomycetota bacterium]